MTLVIIKGLPPRCRRPPVKEAGSWWFLSLGQAGVKSSWKLVATSQGWAKRANQQFRNPIERRFWSWSCSTLETLSKNQHFGDPIETRLVNLAKLGPWPPGAEAAAVSQPLQQAWSCSEAFQVWATRANQQFRNPIERTLWSWSCSTLETL